MTHANLISELIRSVLCANQWVKELVLPLIIIHQGLLPLPFLTEKLHLVNGVFVFTIFNLLIFAAIFD